MYISENEMKLSASDLVGHLNCSYLTRLDFEVAHKRRAKPVENNLFLTALRTRGDTHEKNYIEHLRQKGHSVSVVEGDRINEDTATQTKQFMKDGADIIVQAAFMDGFWIGRPDILRKISVPSKLGNWSYEVMDTKLATETKGGTLLQLSLYAELMARIQGDVPEYVYVVPPSDNYKEERYRTADYSAYFRKVKASLENAVKHGQFSDLYPDPVDHCEVCRWQLECDRRRRSDDHLSLVAGVSRMHTAELDVHDIDTVDALSKMPVPLTWKPKKGSSDGIVKVREQARIQVEGRTKQETIYEILAVEPKFGFNRLPEPSKGDVFFDIEGDPFVAGGGLEYLFGYTFLDENGKEKYVSDWAFDRNREKAIFERFIDFVIQRRLTFPDFHIYHFAPYEPSALKRLMGRYASRELEVDELLRGQKFVDLLAVVRQAIRASVESYSIKKLEPLYKFTREQELRAAGSMRAQLEAAIELDNAKSIKLSELRVVKKYNKDDCVSTWRLRDWLENVRSELIAKGVELDRPAAATAEAGELSTEKSARNAALFELLTRDLPVDALERNADQQAKWLIANMIEWHWRENKSALWEKFRLGALTVADLLEERAALSQLTFVGAVPGAGRIPTHRYRFPPQETDIREGNKLIAFGMQDLGAVANISVEEGWIDIKKMEKTIELHPEAIFRFEFFKKDAQSEAIYRIAADIEKNGMANRQSHSVAKSLLLKETPLGEGIALRMPEEEGVKAACRIIKSLSGRVLSIQGPPGAGKTYTASHMICSLVKEGKKVGITANSHKVIRNLLDMVLKTAEKEKIVVNCVQKPKDEKPAPKDVPHLRIAKTNGDVFTRLKTDTSVAGGTSWLWASEEAYKAVDVLFVDEAAQMSLAEVLAVSQSAKAVVLLGDPQQLEQPIQGSHPDGTDVSALDYIRDGHDTIGEDKGLFLEKTYRLNPDICSFTSELFYESRLSSIDGLDRQIIFGNSRLSGSGLRFLPVNHVGNQNLSIEEVDAVEKLYHECLQNNLTYCDREGEIKDITQEEILIVAPYNAQVYELKKRLPDARVGTVDKFQGQEAAIVIYSMASSSPADAPRGMEFLYSLNRLNVATSRAKCLALIVGSPDLFEASCRTPRQIQLANAFCRYLEVADIIPPLN